MRDDIGPYLKAKWLTLGDHPLVGEARMEGLLGALERGRSKGTLERFGPHVGAGMRCRDLSVGTHGLVMRAVGDTMIVSPPLTLSHEEADALVERARAALDALADELTREKMLGAGSSPLG